MIHDLLMPKLGLTMTEGSVSEWKIAPGETFTVGQVLLVVETDKVSYDVEAERDGVLRDIVVPEGELVAVGTVLAHIAAADAPAPAAVRESRAPAEPRAAEAIAEPLPQPAPAPAAHEAIVDTASGAHRVVATPLARRRAVEAGIVLANIAGTGPGGRIKAADVESVMRSTTTPVPQAPGAGSAIASRRRPSATQAAMARRLSESKHGVPHFYLASEAEVSALEAQRAEWNAGASGEKLTLTTFLVAAMGRALAETPEANTVWMDGELVTYAAADVGIAVHTPRGLYAPVLRDVGGKSLDAIARESRALLERARSGELSAEDMAGGAMTVSNAGMHNVTHMAPIIAPGQSAILGVGSIRQLFRPDADGRPALRRELGLVLAADHRVFDGVSALQFLNRVIDYLQAPARLARR